jgi:hypothetical protein
MGMICADDERATTIIDFAWENTVRVDKWTEHVLWAVPSVDPEVLYEAGTLARHAATKWVESKTLPYGLVYAGSRFELGTGQFVAAPESTGITCASFVLVLFESCSVSLVKGDTWPVRKDDDLAWLENFVGHPMYDRLASDIANGAKRIRPEEVAAACAIDHANVSFDEAKAHVPAVLSLIDEVFPR